MYRYQNTGIKNLAGLLKLAGISKSNFYYHLANLKNPDKYADIKEEINSIYHENKGRYGYRRITAELHNRGFIINHKTVRKLIKVNGIKLYLSPVIDLFNGEVISYALSKHPVFKQVTDMLSKAFVKIPDNTNLILHSD